MRRFLLFMGALMILAGGAHAENLNPRAFTEVVAKAAAALVPSAKVAVTGDLELETRSAGGETTTTDLNNAYQLYVQHPEHLDDVIRRYARVLADTVQAGANATVDRSRIVPVIKSRQWVEGMRQVQDGQNNTQKARLLTEPFNAQLAIVYAEDRPSSTRYLTTRDDAGDSTQLHDLALANLRRVLPKIEMRSGADGTFLVTAGGTYEASLLLVDDLWSGGQIKVDGDIVVAVPARDVLLVTGSHNRAGIRNLHDLAAKLATGPYALTPVLLAYRGGKFVEFDDK
jgi:uncharacterized protein YtpQ (UPF0354 family)